MTHVLNKKCVQNECNVIPKFNWEGELVRLYCSKHKKGGMVKIE